jgi:hypothetical protein|tara:strand:+ start:217 stop:1083 length:867 start_codon:yes stop_codon:yes gene_type:complete
MAQNNLSLEERAHLQDAATAFASYVTEKYPQINEDGQLNYYISGSLAVMLLPQVDSIDLLDSSQLPDVSTRETRSLDGGLSAKIAEFTRPIGDLDFVRTEVYNQALKEANSHYPKDPQKYTELRGKIMTKGGGGPSIDELPDLAKDVLTEAKSGHKVMCDPVSTYGEDQVARVRIQDREYFISDPGQIFGYKVLHLMQSFGNKPDKLKRDFTVLHDALSQLYSEEELIESAYAVLVGFEDSMEQYGPQASKYMRQLDDNPDFNSTVRPFFEKLKQYDVEHRNIMRSNG